MQSIAMRRAAATAAALLLLGVATAEPVPEAAPEHATSTPQWSPTVGSGNHIPAMQEDVVKKVVAKGCSHRYTLTCLKLDAVSFVDRLADTEELQVLPGVTVIRENASGGGAPASGSAESRRAQVELMASLAKDYPRDVDARVDAFLVRRVGHYMDTHAVNVRLLDAASATARAFGDDLLQVVGLAPGGDNTGTGRSKGGGKKGGGMGLLLMGGMMKGMMMMMGMAGVAAIAGKALIVGLMALTLAAVAGLKSLSGGGGGKTTYEIVSKPIYSHEHSHSHEVQHGHGGGYGHSSYGRSFDEALPLEATDGGYMDPPRGGRALNPDPAGPAGPGAANVFTARDAQELAYNGYLKVPPHNVATPATSSSVSS